MGPEQIGLNPDPITVTPGHLQHRLKAGVQKQATDREAAHAHHCAAAVSDIDGLHPVSQKAGHRQSMTGISPSGRHHLSCDCDGTSLKTALQR